MADLNDLLKGRGDNGYASKVAANEDDLEGGEDDAFRLVAGNRQAHTLNVETTDYVNGIPYPMIGGCDFEKKTGDLVIVTPRWDFTLEGDNLLALQMLIGDYKVRTVKAGVKGVVKVRKITRGKEKEAW